MSQENPKNRLPRPEGREGQRIAKLLARAGVASRREIERMIEARRIAIDGVAIETPATIVISLHGVTVDGQPVAAPAPARLFLYHKAAGLLTTERDPKGRPTIYDKLPPDLPRVVPVGRLDLNTEGLLLLTTDGEFKRQLELPATGVERSYRARAYGDVTQAQLEDLIDGVEIEGVRYGSIDANLERRTGANTWIEMRLKEGKNREVRRVLEYLGLQVSRLIRTGYGPFVLDDLPPGEVGEVRQHDLVEFRKTLKTAARAPSSERTPAPKVSVDTTPPAPGGRRGRPRYRTEGTALPPRSSAAAGNPKAVPRVRSATPKLATGSKTNPKRSSSPADKKGWAKPRPGPDAPKGASGGKRPPRARPTPTRR